MNKNTTFPNLTQNLISEDELNVIKEAIGYIGTSRKLTVLCLIQYFVTASVNEWKSYRYCSDV